jgi:hypothetical protein
MREASIYWQTVAIARRKMGEQEPGDHSKEAAEQKSNTSRKRIARESIARQIDKQSQIAERKTRGEYGPGDRSKEAVQQRGPSPTPLTGRAHVGGGSQGKGPKY